MGSATLRILLDTHVWLWRLLEPDRLSTELAETLTALDHEIYLSPISVWETLVLARKGRVALRPEAQAWVRDALAVSRPRLAPLSHEVMMRSEDLPGFRSADPADRFLVATAMVGGLELATANRAMLDYEPVATLA